MNFWSFYCGVSQGKDIRKYFCCCLINKMRDCVVLFPAFDSLLSYSPELQGLLVNQLTVKVRAISDVNYCQPLYMTVHGNI